MYTKAYAKVQNKIKDIAWFGFTRSDTKKLTAVVAVNRFASNPILSNKINEPRIPINK
jgi:hypothetical protein